MYTPRAGSLRLKSSLLVINVIFCGPLSGQTSCQCLITFSYWVYVIIVYNNGLGASACVRLIPFALHLLCKSLTFFQSFDPSENDIERLLVDIAIDDHDLFVLPLRSPGRVLDGRLATLLAHSKVE
jgi:hypothetical protein